MASEKLNANLRARVRRRYRLRCALQGLPAGIAGALVVFEIYFLFRGVPQSVIPFIGCTVFVPVFGTMYAVWACKRVKHAVERFKGLVTWKELHYDGFIVVHQHPFDGQPARRLVGWAFFTDKGFYVVPLARNDDTYCAVKLSTVREIGPETRRGRIRLVGGTLDADLYTYERDGVLAVLKALCERNGVV